MTATQAVERPRTTRAKRFDPAQVGWRIGVGHQPKSGELWCPWDRTAGVIGPQGSGKTLDLLTPALISAPGAALVTLTKPDDLLLSLPERSKQGRPCVVLDPFGLVPGLPELVWDPIAGCVDRMVAERRAKAFTAGTIQRTSHDSGNAAAHFYATEAFTAGTIQRTSHDSGNAAAHFYATEAAKVLMAYFHAAALTGKTYLASEALGLGSS